MEQPKNDVLKVKRLHVEFQTSHGMVHAVKDVSLEVKRGRIHALVGESGSGLSDDHESACRKWKGDIRRCDTERKESSEVIRKRKTTVIRRQDRNDLSGSDRCS